MKNYAERSWVTGGTSLTLGKISVLYIYNIYIYKRVCMYNRVWFIVSDGSPDLLMVRVFWHGLNTEQKQSISALECNRNPAKT